MKYSPRPFERLLTRFIARQTKIIEQLINQFVSDATMQTTRVLPQKTEGDFFFRDYPALSRQIDTLLRGLSSRLTKTIQAGCEWSWDLANTKNDNMLSKVLDSIGRERVPLKALERWNQKNLPALEAFEKRRIGGMGLSDKVWAYSKGIKGDLELALDLGIGQGMSADRLSRVVREYLKEPDRLYRRVRDEKGVLRLSKSASNYHPGQGVYRSSYKNAVRLTATETNMAYRSADNERMNQIEWILGFEVHISDTNHTCLDSHGVPQPFYDICDELQGRYPKWFRFVGWHPNCRCYITTILPEKDEMIKHLAAMDENGHSSYKFKQGEVTDVPPQFKEWVHENQNRIVAAEERGKLPYFISDNKRTVMDIVHGASNYYAPITDNDIKYLSDNGIIGEKILRSTLSHADMRIVQGILSGRIDERAAFDIANYVSIYGKKHPEVVTLSNEIALLRGKDEVLRLRKINQLKNVCGELSAKEIQKWGYAKGLEYVGVEKSYLYAEDHTMTVRGKQIHIKGLRKDLIIFRSSESGKEFAYALGARRADITYDIAKMAGFVDNEMPAYLRKNLNRVVFLNERNPYDKYWAVEYKMPRFESLATDGGNITFWRDTKNRAYAVDGSLLHEAGHAFDRARKITLSKEWTDAVQADIALFDTGKIAKSFPTNYAENVFTATGQVVEDFAESIALKIQWDKKYGEAWFERCFPNRAKVLKEIIARWPLG